MAAPEKKGLSLYSHLLPPTSTISSAPVKYGPEGSPPGDGNQQAKKPKDASLQFQPMRRPPGMQKLGKVKPAIPPFSSSSSAGHKMSSSTTAAASDPATSTLAISPDKQPTQVSASIPQLGQKRAGFEDWVAGDDEDSYYYEQNRSSRKNKKKKNQLEQSRSWSWNDIYDPLVPTDQAAYKKSEEKHEMVAAWKAYLRRAHAKIYGPKVQSQQQHPAESAIGQPAIPSNLNFAPPTSYGDDTAQASNDETGEDAYARRMRMAGVAGDQMRSSPPHPPKPDVAPSLPDDRAAIIARQLAEMKAKIEAQRMAQNQNTQSVPSAISPNITEASLSSLAPSTPPPAPPPPPSATDNTPVPMVGPISTLSRAPVRYEAADIKPDAASEEAPVQPGKLQSNYSKKEGFAQRYMEKLGWDGKTGLGAQEQGIMTAIKVLPEKRKKRPDAEGGGFVMPANMGKIVGGKKAKTKHEDDDGVGKVSVVVKLSGMLDGMDVDQEIQDNNLLQEIGDDLGENYGTIERLFVWREENGGSNEVFVKFTNQASAVRAVNGMEGTTFGDNHIAASYWDPDKFDSGVYI